MNLALPERFDRAVQWLVVTPDFEKVLSENHRESLIFDASNGQLLMPNTIGTYFTNPLSKNLVGEKR